MGETALIFQIEDWLCVIW